MRADTEHPTQPHAILLPVIRIISQIVDQGSVGGIFANEEGSANMASTKEPNNVRMAKANPNVDFTAEHR